MSRIYPSLPTRTAVRAGDYAELALLEALERGLSDVHGRSRFAKLSIRDGSKVKIAPVHSDF